MATKRPASSTKKAAPVKKAAPAKKAPATKAPAKKAAPGEEGTGQEGAGQEGAGRRRRHPPRRPPAAKKAPAKKARAGQEGSPAKKAAAPAKKAARPRRPRRRRRRRPRRLRRPRRRTDQGAGIIKKAPPAKTPVRQAVPRRPAGLAAGGAGDARDQAEALKAEADALTFDREPGDVQFDDESGEGDTLAVERDFDLARAAAARQTIEEIDAALERIDKGTYGICEYSGQSHPAGASEGHPVGPGACRVQDPKLPLSTAANDPMTEATDTGSTGRIASGRRWAMVLGVAVAVIALDQLSKWWALRPAADRRRRRPDRVAAVQLAYNTGMAFSKGAGSGAIIGLVALGIVVVMAFAASRSTTKVQLVLIGVVIGGALGNIIDRLSGSARSTRSPGRPPRGSCGAVVDFIDLQWWPMFNVADAAVCAVDPPVLSSGLAGPKQAQPVETSRDDAIRPRRHPLSDDSDAPRPERPPRPTVTEDIPPALAGERVDRLVALITGCSRSEASELIGAEQVLVSRRRGAQGLAPSWTRATSRLPPIPHHAPRCRWPTRRSRCRGRAQRRRRHRDRQAGRASWCIPGRALRRHAGPRPARPVPGDRRRRRAAAARASCTASTGAPRACWWWPARRRPTPTSSHAALQPRRGPGLHRPRVAPPGAPPRRHRRPHRSVRRDPLRMTVAVDGRESRTHYRVDAEFAPAGRHVAADLPSWRPAAPTRSGCTWPSIGHPVRRRRHLRRRPQHFPMPRPFLHAARLASPHPGTGERWRSSRRCPPTCVRAGVARPAVRLTGGCRVELAVALGPGQLLAARA